MFSLRSSQGFVVGTRFPGLRGSSFLSFWGRPKLILHVLSPPSACSTLPHTSVCAHAQTRAQAHTHIRVCTHKRTRTSTHTSVCAHAHTHAQAHTCSHAHTHVTPAHAPLLAQCLLLAVTCSGGFPCPPSWLSPNWPLFRLSFSPVPPHSVASRAGAVWSVPPTMQTVSAPVGPHGPAAGTRRGQQGNVPPCEHLLLSHLVGVPGQLKGSCLSPPPLACGVDSVPGQGCDLRSRASHSI